MTLKNKTVCIATALPEVPTKFYSMTLKQKATGTGTNRNSLVISVLVVLDSLSLWDEVSSPFSEGNQCKREIRSVL